MLDNIYIYKGSIFGELKGSLCAAELNLQVRQSIRTEAKKQLLN
jgi:hypothetical protein